MRFSMYQKSGGLLRRILWATGITLGALLIIFLANYLTTLYLSRERTVPVTDQPEITTLNFELDPGISYQNAANDAALYFYSAQNLKIINKKGEPEQDMSLKLSRPMISVRGTYALFFDLGGRTLMAFDGAKETLSLELEENILLAKINKNGYMLLITESDLHKCAARVYTPDGKEIFKWNSGGLSVIGGDISDNNKDITISAANTDEGTIKNQIIMFNIAKEKPFTNDTYEGDLFPVICYSGGYLYCIGTADTHIYNNYGKRVGTAAYADRELQHYNTDGNMLVLAFSGATDGAGACEIKSYNHKGEEVGSFTAPQEFDFIDAEGGSIAINNGRTISLLTDRCQERRQINLSFDLRDFAFFGGQSKGVGITASGAELISLN